MYPKLYLLLFLALLLNPCKAFEYQYNFINYNVDDGLPTPQFYTIIQDPKGYIWLGSAKGLVRYNGRDFEIYTADNGLSNIEVFQVDVLPSGQIACFSNDRKIYILGEDQRFYPFYKNDSLIHNISAGFNAYKLDFSENGLALYLSGKGKNSTRFISMNYGRPIIIDQSPGYYIRDDEEGVGFGAGTKPDSAVNFIHFNDKKVYFDKPIIEWSSRMAFDKHEHDYYFSIGEQLFSYNPLKDSCINTINNFEYDIYTIEADQDGYFYVGGRKFGVCKFHKKKPFAIENILPNIYCSDVLIDDNGGIWITSLFNGLYYCANENIKKLKLEEEAVIVEIKKFNDQLFAGLNNGKLVKVDGQKLTEVEESTQLDSYDNPSDNYIVFRGYSFSVHGKLLNCDNLSYKNISHYFSNQLMLEDSIITVSRSSLRLVGLNGREVKIYNFKNIINDLAYHEPGKYLIGTNQGVKLFSQQGYMKSGEVDRIDHFQVPELPDYKPEIPFFRDQINGLINIGDSIVVYASNIKGIFIEKKGKPFAHLTKENGLINNCIERLFFIDQKIITTATNGVSIIDREKGIRNYSKADGFVFNYLTGSTIFKDTVYLATDVGTYIIPEKEKKVREIPVYLKQISFNGVKQKLKRTYHVDYKVDNLGFSFEGIKYIQKEKVIYRFQLTGLDKTWTTSSSQSVRYNNIPSGQYSFWISTQRSDKSWSKPVCLFRLIKSQPFWEKLWFMLVLSSFGIGVVWMLIRWYYKRQQRKDRDKLKVLNLERKTLQAQMNPHFMFNSMTSLQSLILDDKKMESYEFLERFAKLTRHSLNHSTQNLITLREEMEFLKMYIELEQVRFNQNFVYEIIDYTNQPSQKIAPMLIQPFVENAIIHGLMKKKNGGKLTIKFTPRDEITFLCTITDNGKGRKQVSGSERKSLGIQLVRGRLGILLDKIVKEPVEIIDLKENGIAKGTCVVVTLPINPTIL